MADEIGIHLFSTPFDPSAVDFLEAMNVPAYKIASFEVVDLPLVRKIAQTGKPIIMSTGMATLAEIDEAVQAIREAGGSQLALLKCTSGYPALPEEMNLRTIPHLAEAFGVPVGLSDHTLGLGLGGGRRGAGGVHRGKALYAFASGAGPDSAFSLEPAEFKAMVDAIRIAEKALGRVHYGVSPREAASRGVSPLAVRRQRHECRRTASPMSMSVRFGRPTACRRNTWPKSSAAAPVGPSRPARP